LVLIPALELVLVPELMSQLELAKPDRLSLQGTIQPALTTIIQGNLHPAVQHPVDLQAFEQPMLLTEPSYLAGYLIELS
jgi:hypothetical protein